MGVDLFVPCLNTTTSPGWSAVEVVDAQSGVVVANLSVDFPTYYVSMAFDPLDGLLYVTTGPGTLARIDVANDTVTGNLTVPGASWMAGLHPYLIAFDPSTDELIVPSVAGGLLGVDPVTGMTQRSLPLPVVPFSLAVDPTLDWIVATTYDPSTVMIYNATTYRLVAHFGIPDCPYVGCNEENPVLQVLFDPVHGDAYLLGEDALVTLNLSAISLIGWSFSEVCFDFGSTWNAVYVPSTDQIFGIYSPDTVHPGYVVQLNHDDRTVVSSLVWIPTDAAILVLAAAAGAVIAVGHAGRSRRGPR